MVEVRVIRYVRPFRIADTRAHKPRGRVDTDKVRAEAWGPLTDATRAEDKSRIAAQAARMHGVGGLF